jgi:hypothetical protein
MVTADGRFGPQEPPALLQSRARGFLHVMLYKGAMDGVGGNGEKRKARLGALILGKRRHDAADSWGVPTV